MSPSSRRAWIEICTFAAEMPDLLVALLAEGVDRNVIQASVFSGMPSSPSSRRAWIEICTAARGSRQVLVALLAEGVDRNSPCHCRRQTRAVVALLAEGVDRNSVCHRPGSALDVALLAEGVDRNIGQRQLRGESIKSPSSRRAWIEIGQCVQCHRCFQSPSSRRAWIEICWLTAGAS